jgi:hypothetical protein
MGETRNTNTAAVVKSDGANQLKSLNAEEKILLKRILKKADRAMAWRRFIRIRTSGMML